MAEDDRERRTNVSDLSDQELLAQLERFVAELGAAEEEARKLGVFVDDRELLDCEACGLREDVTHQGLLITYFGVEVGADSGLRFRDGSKEGLFVCPSCGAEVREPEEPLRLE